MSERRDSNSRPLAWKANALPTELLSHCKMVWGEQDSNLRRRTPADLQSAPVGHFGISPKIYNNFLIEPMEGFEPTTC